MSDAIHYTETQNEKRIRLNSSGTFTDSPLCGNGSAHATHTRMKNRVNCPACIAKLKGEVYETTLDKISKCKIANREFWSSEARCKLALLRAVPGTYGYSENMQKLFAAQVKRAFREAMKNRRELMYFGE